MGKLSTFPSLPSPPNQGDISSSNSSSSTSDSDFEVDVFLPEDDDIVPPEQPETQPPPNPPLRRSARSTKGHHSNINRQPLSVLNQQHLLLTSDRQNNYVTGQYRTPFDSHEYWTGIWLYSSIMDSSVSYFADHI